ncbi:MAG: hypothetical protein AB7U23_13215 [Dehalococcoidia bacterium]
MGTSSIGAAPGEAGVAVQSTTPTPPAVPAPLGTTLIVGGFRWGPVGEVIQHPGVSHYGVVRDRAMRASSAPFNCENFYTEAQGTGRLLTLRLVDGSQRAASLDVYCRDVNPGRRLLSVADHALPTKFGAVSGAYVGRRGGQSAYLAGHLADRGAAFSATAGTFATSTTMVVDRFKDATLGFVGHARTYKITANSAAGVLSIEVPTGDAGPTGAGKWYVVLGTTRFDGLVEGLGIRIDNGGQNPGTEVALDVRDLLGAVSAYAPESLSSDTSLESYWDSVVNRANDDGRQHYVRAAVESISDPSADELRPANLAALVHPDSGAANVLKVVTHHWSRTVASGGNAYFDPTGLTYGASPIRCKAICTFTAATTANVEFFTWEGVSLGSFLVSASAGLTLGTNFNTQIPGLPAFTLRAGSSGMSAADTITVWFQPLGNLSAHGAAYLYPHGHDQGDSATNDIRTRLLIIANTADTITVAANVALGADHDVLAPTRPTLTGTEDATFTLSGSETFIYTLNAETPVTLTESGLGAGSYTAAQIAAELQAREDAAHTPRRLTFAAAGTKVSVTATHDYGSDASLTLGNGTINSILGFTNSQTDSGTDGTVVAVSFVQELWDGRDGTGTLGINGEYEDAFSTETSPLLTLRNRNLGLIKVGMPGVSTAAAQNAMIAYCDRYGYATRYEIAPANASSEDTAAAWVRNNIVPSRNAAVAWDSYGYPRRKPFKGQDVAYPMTGAIFGMESRLAAANRGYHITAAGLRPGSAATISATFRSLASATGSGDPPLKKDKDLFPTGLQAVNQQGASVYVWGARNTEDGFAGGAWKHKVESVLHIMHLLRPAAASAVFGPTDPTARMDLERKIEPHLRDLFNAGWFNRESEQTFEDVVVINSGPDLNTSATQAAGQLLASVSIPGGIVGTAERVIIALSPGSVSVQESAV